MKSSPYIIYVILLLLPTYLVRFSIFGIPTTLLEALIYIGLIIFLASSIFEGKLAHFLTGFVKNPFFIPLTLFLLAGAISVFVSPDKMVALGIFKAYFLDAYLFSFMLLSIIKTRGEAKICFGSLLISAFAVSAIGALQYLFLPEYLQGGRVKSIFSSPNYLSLYVAPVSFLGFSLLGKTRAFNLRNTLLLLAYVIIILVLFLTYSRGAWLGVLLGAVFFLGALAFRRLKSKITRVTLLGVSLMTLVATFFFIIGGVYSLSLVSRERVFTSDNVRKEIWATSFDIGSKNWLMGIGLGNFQEYFREHTKGTINYPEYITPHAITPHNVFLNLWLQVGLLGLLSIVATISLFTYTCIRGARNGFLINIALLSSMVAILGQGLVDSAIWKNDLILVFWFIILSSYIINREGEKNGK